MVEAALIALAAALAVLGVFHLSNAFLSRVGHLFKRHCRLTLAVIRKARSGESLKRTEVVRLEVACFAASLLLLMAPLGLELALALALVSSFAARKAVLWHAGRRAVAIANALPELARSMASALESGCSVRSALHEVSGSFTGPIAVEVKRIEAELKLGVATDEAFQGFNERVATSETRLFVAAILIQRKVGGNLVKLLRDIALAAEDRRRLSAEVSAASAQARFTALLVLALPAGAALMAQLASPGLIATVTSSFAAIWLVGLSLTIQAIGLLVIRRLSRAPLRGLR